MMAKILAQIVFYVIHLLNLTYRYEFVGLEHKSLAKKSNPKETFIYALWHQNLISAIFSHIGEKFAMPISESKDGELVAVTCEKLGHAPARGSSSRGGNKALLDLVKKVRGGLPAAVTVDGPRGPARIVKPGVIEIARLSQCPILPLSPYPARYWSFAKSWDHFRVPKPFSKIIVVIGEPIYVTAEMPREDFPAIAERVGDSINRGEQIAKTTLQTS